MERVVVTSVPYQIRRKNGSMDEALEAEEPTDAFDELTRRKPLAPTKGLEVSINRRSLQRTESAALGNWVSKSVLRSSGRYAYTTSTTPRLSYRVSIYRSALYHDGYRLLDIESPNFLERIETTATKLTLHIPALEASQTHRSRFS